MKRLIPLLAIVLAGCHLEVKSREPFYTDNVRTNASQLLGEWWNGATTWIFTGERTLSVRSYEAKGFQDQVVIPFQIAGRTFIDLAAADKSYHTLYCVDLTGRELKLTTLDGDWLTNAIATGQVNLPAPRSDSQSNLMFVASSAQWVAFLKSQNGQSPDAYGDSTTYQKSPNANFIPARRQQP